MWFNSIKTAWRTILKYKTNAALNMVGLSMGLCASLVFFLITQFEFGFDTFHPDKERIYRIVAREGKTGSIGGTINALPATLRQELARFQSVTTFYNYYARVMINDTNQQPKVFDAIRPGEGVSPLLSLNHSILIFFTMTG